MYIALLEVGMADGVAGGWNNLHELGWWGHVNEIMQVQMEVW